MGFTEFDRVLPSFTGSLPSFIEIHWFLPITMVKLRKKTKKRFKGSFIFIDEFSRKWKKKEERGETESIPREPTNQRTALVGQHSALKWAVLN